MFRCKRLIILLILSASLTANTDVPSENILAQNKLPASFPDSWVYAHDINGSAYMFGQYVVFDVGAESQQFKGNFQGIQLANFVESKTRSEFYVAETFYSRGNYGERTDVLSIYDKENLSVIDEVVLSGGKRALITPHKGQLQLTGNEQFALLFNFTPAASVTVIDVVKRTEVSEVAIPGCSLIFPVGDQGFFTLCANGALASFQLDKQGQVKNQSLSESFNDMPGDILFMESATLGNTTYIPSFLGHIRPIQTDQPTPTVKPAWSLLTEADKAEGWRPSGRQPIASHASGKLFVLMKQQAIDGNHYDGGEQVWVFDPVNKRRIARYTLNNKATVIEVTRGKTPYLTVATKDGLDIYNAHNGAMLRHIGGQAGFIKLYASQ